MKGARVRPARILVGLLCLFLGASAGSAGSAGAAVADAGPVTFSVAPGSVLLPNAHVDLGGSGPALLKTIYGGVDGGAFSVTLPTSVTVQPLLGRQPGYETSLELEVMPQCGGCAPASADYTVEQAPERPDLTVFAAPTTFYPFPDGYQDTFAVTAASRFNGTMTLTLFRGHTVAAVTRAKAAVQGVTLRLRRGLSLGSYTWQLSMAAPRDPVATTRPRVVRAVAGRLSGVRTAVVGGPAAGVAHIPALATTPCSRPVDRRGTVILDNDKQHPCYQPAEVQFLVLLNGAVRVTAATLTITTDGGAGGVQIVNGVESRDRQYTLHGRQTVIRFHATDFGPPAFSPNLTIYTKQDHDVVIQRLTITYRYQALLSS